MNGAEPHLERSFDVAVVGLGAMGSAGQLLSVHGPSPRHAAFDHLNVDG